MNDVVGIIDMDEFMIEKKFYCKELGVLKVGEEEASSFIFDMGIRWRDLTPKQQRQCMFLTRNIHKLPFGLPRRAKAFPHRQPGHNRNKFLRSCQIKHST